MQVIYQVFPYLLYQLSAPARAGFHRMMHVTAIAANAFHRRILTTPPLCWRCRDCHAPLRTSLWPRIQAKCPRCAISGARVFTYAHVSHSPNRRAWVAGDGCVRTSSRQRMRGPQRPRPAPACDRPFSATYGCQNSGLRGRKRPADATRHHVSSPRVRASATRLPDIPGRPRRPQCNTPARYGGNPQEYLTTV